jgi:hypothetical protein
VARSQEELDAAIEAISEPAALRDAQDLVMRVAPALQRVLAVALEDGGWFGAGHDQAVREAVASEDQLARVREVRTLVAEETRLGMFVGVAVGIGLAQQLGLGSAGPGAEDHPEQEE